MNHDCFTLGHHQCCDELLAIIISFLDFKSAVIFTTRTSHRLERRIFGSQHESTRCFDELWKEIFRRHYFSPVEYLLPEEEEEEEEEENTSCGSNDRDHHDHEDASGNNKTKRTKGMVCGIDYMEHCYHRLALLDNLTHGYRFRDGIWNDYSFRRNQTRRRREEHDLKLSCSSFPSKCFHFLPIAPSSSSHVHPPQDFLDYPSVDFPCSSYHLTSPGVEGEYVFLNPFDGEVAVFSNIQTHRDSMVHFLEPSTRGDTMEHLHQDESSQDDAGDDNTNIDDDDDDDADRQEEESSVLGQKEILFGVQDYFNMNLHEYFYHSNHNGSSHYGSSSLDMNLSFQAVSVEEEVVVDWMGVDVHNIVDASGNITGTMVCAAREISVDGTMNTAATTTRVPTLFELWNGHERANNYMDRNKSCTELIAWKKMTKHGKYSDARYACRLDGSPYYIEVCPVKDRVYACFSPGTVSNGLDESIHGGSELAREEHPPVNIDEMAEENLMIDTDVMAEIKRSRCIRIFPLLKQTQSMFHEEKSSISTPTGRRFFPDVQQQFWCKYPITSLAIEPTGGHLIVGAENGTMEIWNVQYEPLLVQRTDISSQLMRKTNVSVEDTWIESMTTTQINTGSELFSGENSDTDDESERLERLHEFMLSHEIIEPLQRRVSYASALDHLNESIMRDESTNEDYIDMSQSIESDVTDEHMVMEESTSTRRLCQCNPRRMINEIIISRHLPIQKGGFITLQHHRDEGTTLALWLFNKQHSSFAVSSLVNLPLSTQRRPTVLYDGKKLVVFGQDHIGLILLIYRVISSPEDVARSFSPPVWKGKKDSSGGVINLNGMESIVYVNRIRHAALGGIEYYDNILMTMNERFLIVNTKTGNLLQDGNAETDGLLVIDLQL